MAFLNERRQPVHHMKHLTSFIRPNKKGCVFTALVFTTICSSAMPQPVKPRPPGTRASMNLSSVQLIPELKDAATDYQEFKNYSLPLNLQSLTSAVERVTSFPPLPTPSTTKKREPDLPLHAKQDKRGIFGWFKARKKKALRQTVEEEPKAEETIQGEAGEVPLAKSPATAPSVKPIGVQVGAPLPEKSKGEAL
eukprot:gene3119-3954_t